MNKIPVGHIIFSVVVLLVQVVLLRSVEVPVGPRFTLLLFLYPAAILLTPVEVDRSILITAAFFMGLFVDLFYDSPGVHTSALVLTAFVRDLVLRIMEPRQGYRGSTTLGFEDYGASWFLTYLGIGMLVHTFTYFSVDAFSFVYILKILVNTVLTFIASYLIIILYKMVVR